MNHRKSLTEILGGAAGVSKLRDVWNTTEAAAERAPIPTGDYVALVVSGGASESRTNQTPCYRLEFRILESEHKGARCWHDCWLTPAALPHTKRDLKTLGITTAEQLEAPLPAGIVVKLRVVLRKEDDGNERNAVRSFEFLRIDRPEADPFAPVNPDATPAGDAAAGVPF